ncbi:LysR family transcriptional regulator [Lacrimispora algidixylanolytica]|uniref:LysR family transcriptional regulator n=1 Tax=Lacrimispora algidixylanolytica TaxID=94868 RepID=A0A419SZ88_9FIRM|nr:LysR family transcriptional regulator [Lacrimispora algidixylanolytica]RKD30469.1 LysR family transcriptional regulator [Lacrimispora algidixylanolytica]
MELKEARYILAIAKEQNISKAAETLFISQPSLSKYLKNLELQLGTRLFDRIGSRYSPTYIGERYIHYAEKIVEYGIEWDIEFDDIMHQNHGRLNIAIPIMLGNSLIGPTLFNFHKQYPNVTVNMLEEVNFVAEHTLTDHTVDLTFYNVHEFPTNLDYQIIGKEEMVLVLSAHNPLVSLAEKKEGYGYPWIDLSLLSKEPFILLYPDQNTGGLALKLFKDYHMEPDILLHTRNSEMSICLAMEGLGAAFAPESYYHYLKKREPKESVCLSIGKERMENTLIAAYQKNRYLPKYAKAYLDILANYCSEAHYES